jgi:hypothetical protein
MLEDDLAYVAPRTRGAVVFELLNDIETIRMQPILALRIALHRAHVHWLIAHVPSRNGTASPAHRESWASVRNFILRAAVAGAR